MTIINLQQGTPEWLEWRNKGIGASEASIIVGMDKFNRTPHKLWLEKLGKAEPVKPNRYMLRGQMMEEQARHAYMHSSQVPVSPACYEDDVYPFVHASVDGISFDGKVVIEIKCPGAATHAIALEGKVPEWYYPQCQQILLVTNAEKLDYYSFDGKEGVVIEVLPNVKYQKKLLKKLIEFWDCVTTNTQPPLESGDHIFVDKNDFMEQEKILLEKDLAYRQAKEDYEEARNALFEMTDGHNCRGHIFRCSRIFTKGIVDVKRIRDEAHIDIENYRKRGGSYWKLTKLRENVNGCYDADIT